MYVGYLIMYLKYVLSMACGYHITITGAQLVYIVYYIKSIIYTLIRVGVGN